MRDGSHAAAIEFHATLVRGSEGRLVTSDRVMDETLTLPRKRSGGEAARSFARGLEASGSVQRVCVSPAHYQSALGLFLGQGAHA